MRRLDPTSLGQHLDALYRAAWALCGSHEDAEDLVQETFARVLARPRVIRGDERGYLMRALRNTFYSRLRTASRRPQTGVSLDDVQPADPRSIFGTSRHRRNASRFARAVSPVPAEPAT